jgi:hypothetical protein
LQQCLPRADVDAVLGLSNALVFLQSSDRQFTLSIGQSLGVGRIVRKNEVCYDSPSAGRYTFDDLARWYQLELPLISLSNAENHLRKAIPSLASRERHQVDCDSSSVFVKWNG